VERTPDIGAAVGSAFRDAVPLMRSRRTALAVYAALCALAGLGVPFAHGMGVSPSGQNLDLQARIQIAIQTPNVLGAVAALFVVIPSVARSGDPAFRMSAGKFFGMLGVAIVALVATEIGMFFFVVPGVYVGVKLSQSVWTFLLGSGQNPWAESWSITSGAFRPTLLFLFALACGAAVPLSGFFVAVVVAFEIPFIAVVAMPIAFLAYVYAFYAVMLGQMRWMSALRSGTAQAAVSLAPAVT